MHFTPLASFRWLFDQIRNGLLRSQDTGQQEVLIDKIVQGEMEAFESEIEFYYGAVDGGLTCIQAMDAAVDYVLGPPLADPEDSN